jgi:hypothetical protein
MRCITFALGVVLLFGLSSAKAEETDAEKVLNEYGEFVVGGSWKGIGAGGVETELKHVWIAEKKFIQVTQHGSTAVLAVISVDPNSKQVNIWWFLPLGLSTTVVTREKDGVWILDNCRVNEERQIVSTKVRITKLEPDKMQLTTLESNINGKPQNIKPAPASVIWTRQK